MYNKECVKIIKSMTGRHRTLRSPTVCLSDRYYGQLYPPHKICHKLATLDVVCFEKEMSIEVGTRTDGSQRARKRATKKTR